MANDVSIHLSNDEALVLFDWLGERENAVVLYDDEGRLVSAEEFALNRIYGQLEKALVEPFDAAYMELLTAARERILNGA